MTKDRDSEPIADLVPLLGRNPTGSFAAGTPLFAPPSDSLCGCLPGSPNRSVAVEPAASGHDSTRGSIAEYIASALGP